MLKRYGSERGATFVEFAITIPILIFFVALIIDWSLMLQELFKVRRAFDRAERSMTAASSINSMPGDDALKAAGTIYRNDLRALGVKLERVLMNPAALTQPVANRQYLLMTGSRLPEPNSSLPFPVNGLFQLNVQYRPRCYLCKLLDGGLRLKTGSPGFIFNMSAFIAIEDIQSLGYFCSTGEALAFTHKFSNSAVNVACQSL